MPQSLRWPAAKSTLVSPIGLDIGPSSVRAAQLERGSDGCRVLRVSCWNRRGLESGTTMPEGFAKRIRSSLQQAAYQGRRAIAGLSIPEVEFHALETPDHRDLESAAKFGRAVRWEMERVTGVPVDDAVYDYWRLPPSKGTNTTTIGVAARSSEVTAATELAHAVGLDCERVDATSCALSRLGTVAGYGGGDRPCVWGALDIGYRMLRLVVSIGDTPVLVRTLGDGSHGWTKRIAESLGLSSDAAEIHKRDHGIDTTASGNDAGASTEVAGMILSILRSDFDAVAAEIERSYEYVMRCYPDRSAAGLLLAGLGSDLAGLGAHLARKLGVDVRGLNEIVKSPTTRLGVVPSIRESLSGYACAIGLAIDPEAPR